MFGGRAARRTLQVVPPAPGAGGAEADLSSGGAESPWPLSAPGSPLGLRSGSQTPRALATDIGYSKFMIDGFPGTKHAMLIPDDLPLTPALLDRICDALGVEPPDMLLSGVSSLAHPSALSTPALRACEDFSQLMEEARTSMNGPGSKSLWERLPSIRGLFSAKDPAGESEEQRNSSKDFADRVLESKVEAAVNGVAAAAAEANAWIFVNPVISNFEVILQRIIANDATGALTVAAAHLQDKAYMEAKLSKRLMKMLVMSAKPLSVQAVEDALPVVLPADVWDQKRKGVDPEFAKNGFSSWTFDAAHPERPSGHPMFQWPWPWADLFLLSYRRKDAAESYYRGDQVDWVYTTERRLDADAAPALGSLVMPGHVFLCGGAAAKKKLLTEVHGGRPAVILNNTPGISKQMSLLVGIIKGLLGQSPGSAWYALLQDGTWRQLPSNPNGVQIIRSLSPAKLLRHIETAYDNSSMEVAARLTLSDIVGLLDVAARSPEVFREAISVVDPLADDPEHILTRLSSTFWRCYLQTLSGSSREVTSSLALKGWRLHSRLSRSCTRLGRLSTLLSVANALALVLSTCLALTFMYFELARNRELRQSIWGKYSLSERAVLAGAVPPEGDVTITETLWKLRVFTLVLPLTASLLTTCQSHFQFYQRWAVVYMAHNQVVAEIFQFLGSAGPYSPARQRDRGVTKWQSAAEASCEIFLRRLQDIMTHLSTTGILSSSGVSEDSLEGDASDENFSAESAAIQQHISRTLYAYGEVPISLERGWDLLSPITSEGYRELRVAPLMKYYTRRAKTITRRRQVLNLAVFALWGASSALAICGDSLWVPACVAMIAFCTTLCRMLAPQESVNAMKKAFDTMKGLDVLWYGQTPRAQRLPGLRLYMIVHAERAVLETAAAFSSYPQGLFDVDAFES